MGPYATDGRSVIVAMPEQVDMLNAEQVFHQLHAALICGAAVVIADFTATAFCDSAGLNRLVTIHKRAVCCDVQFWLVLPPSGTVRRVLKLLGLDQLLPVYSTVAEATGVLPVPGGPFMTGKLLFGGIDFYSIYAKTKHPTEARLFLEALTTGQGGLAWSLTVPGHLLPALKSVATQLRDRHNHMVASNAFMQKHSDWVYKQMDMTAAAYSPALNMGSVTNSQYLGKASNVCPWGNQIWGTPPIDGTMLQQILIQGKDPEAAWKDAATKMGAIATQWLDQNPGWKPQVSGSVSG